LNQGRDPTHHEYKFPKPTIYDITKIKKVPIALFTGVQDKLASINNVLWVKDHLRTTKFLHVYNNLD
jgi:hypothetical protein